MGILYAPTKLAQFIFPGQLDLRFLLLCKQATLTSDINTFIGRIILCGLTSLTFLLVQKQINRVFGSRAAVNSFLLLAVSTSMQASRMTADWICMNVLMTSLAFWIDHNLMSSLACACLALPIIKDGRCLSFLLTLAPLYLNAASFTADSLAVFSYLCLTLMTALINPTLNITAPNWKSMLFDANILVFGTACLFAARRGSSRAGKLLACAVISLAFAKEGFCAEFVPALMIACAISNASKDPFSWIFYFSTLFMGVQSALMILSSSVSQAAGTAGFYFNDLLSKESSFASAHVSSTAVALGFTKISCPYEVEFGTQYSEREMLQKFQYRLADINENIDPAYWITHSVHHGISEEISFKSLFTSKKLRLAPQVKIMIRRPVDY